MIDCSKLNNKFDINKIFLFNLGSNFSLYLVYLFINKYNIKYFKIIFTGNNNANFIELYNYLNLDKSNLLILDGKLNYNYLKMFNLSNNIFNNINSFINSQKFNYFTSMNYGLINSMIIKKYSIKNIGLVDDGFSNWVKSNTYYLLIKSLLYSIVLKKIIFLEKNIYKDHKIKINVTHLNDCNIYDNNKTIFLNTDLINLIKKTSSNHYNYFDDKLINILVILPKLFHFKNNFSTFLKNIDDKILTIDNSFSSINYRYYFKMHPSDKFILKKINLSNAIIIKNSFIPIEFLINKKIKYILSPPNTFMVNLKYLNLFNINNVYYYKVNQTDYKKKESFVKKIGFKKIF